MFTLINFELQDETQDKKYTRDLFVAAIRSLGRTNFEHMLELAEWRLHRYQDERAQNRSFNSSETPSAWKKQRPI